MDKIQPTILNDTLNLVQLARETARLRGSQNQAKRMDPVVEQLQTLVTQERSRQTAMPSGIMAQDDFKTLLDAARTPKSVTTAVSSPMERHRMVMSLSGGGMNEIDIARQMGMTRDEVRTVINLAAMNTTGWR